jgi:hypothetical protein
VTNWNLFRNYLRIKLEQTQVLVKNTCYKHCRLENGSEVDRALRSDVLESSVNYSTDIIFKT